MCVNEPLNFPRFLLINFLVDYGAKSVIDECIDSCKFTLHFDCAVRSYTWMSLAECRGMCDYCCLQFACRILVYFKVILSLQITCAPFLRHDLYFIVNLHELLFLCVIHIVYDMFFK
jgi:hypothetical protein